MIERKQMQDLADRYESPRIGVLGSHSALEIMDGAKDEKLGTVVFCQKGRETPYRRFGRIVDDMVVLGRFRDMASAKNISLMKKTSTLIVPHRSLAAYLGYDVLEDKLAIPVFGNRRLFRAEERDERRNQYYLLRKAGIRHPRILSPKSIDGPAIVKVQERGRTLERAFFTVSSYGDYMEKSERKIDRGIISREGLERAKVEELAIGTYMNFNYFASPLSKTCEFMGIERRLQTNVMDFNALPARQQQELDVDLQNIEVGHTPASLRESLLEQVLEMGDDFVRAVRSAYPPGMIGPFSLQSVITKDLEMVVYDVSLRVPGNPILATTSPYTKYQHGHTIGIGRRIAMEIRAAIEQREMPKLVT